jgi:23S rRNA (uracil1939-C5)-methyltransferase
MAALEKNEPAFPGALGVLFNAKPIKGSAVFQVDLAGCRFQVDAASFFQVNYEGAEKLVETVTQSLGDAAGGALVDLYAGVGTFAIALGKKFDRVVGIEIARSAVRDYKSNIEMNKAQNVDLVEGPVEKVLPQVVSALPPNSPVTVLADPPRTGLEGQVIPVLTDLHPHQIIYVSCDPATLARDVAALGEWGYTLQSLEIIDLFPQTAHVECVAVLKTDGKTPPSA